MMKRLPALLLVVPLLAVLSRHPAQSADEAPANVGKKVGDFTLTDVRDQKRVSLSDFKDKKAAVVVFLGVECPVNNAYAPRLVQLHKDYAPKGVQFLAVNSNQQDGAEKIAAHAKKHELPFPVLKDDGQKVADQFGCKRTPEAFLLDGEGKILYRGRIDDQYGIGYQKPNPTRHDLAQALDEVLAGKGVTTASTAVSGCLIGRAPKAKADDVTYTKHVARILQNNCQGCHRPGQIGPMPLLTYDDAAAWSGMIKEVVKDGRMPPWHADPRYGKFSNDRSLPKEDKDTLLAWIDKGCPQGDAKDLPPKKEFGTESWVIGKPDAVFTMPKEFEVPTESPKYGVPYQYFSVETDFKEDRWVARAQARPGAPGVVHHIIVFVLPPGQRFDQRSGSAVLCGTAPGDMPFVAPDGMAKKVPAGSKLVFQMHYTPNGTAAKDRSSVGLVFAKGPPEKKVLVQPIANQGLRIPPGEANHRVESSFTFKEDGHVLNFMPHMHVRGKDFLVEAIYPDGKTETLLSVPRFDFGWQSVYRFVKPLPMPQGTKIHCVAHFDNSANNPNNPDPTKEVRWGDQTWEEMMIGWMDYVYERKAE